MLIKGGTRALLRESNLMLQTLFVSQNLMHNQVWWERAWCYNLIRKILVREKGANFDHDGWIRFEDQNGAKGSLIRGERTREKSSWSRPPKMGLKLAIMVRQQRRIGFGNIWFFLFFLWWILREQLCFYEESRTLSETERNTMRATIRVLMNEGERVHCKGDFSISDEHKVAFRD